MNCEKQELREDHNKEFLVQFRGSIYIEALNEEEAEEFMRDRDDLVKWIDTVKVK